MFYLTLWFPSWRSARTLGLFILVTPLSTIIGSPLSGFILKAFEGVEGLHNWQWLFVVEAIPSFLLAFVVLRYLDNDVKSARWLSDEEKQVVSDDLEIDRQRGLKANAGKPPQSLKMMFRNGYVWLLALIFFSFNIGYYGINFWLPSIIKSSGVSDDFHIGLLAALPYVSAPFSWCGTAVTPICTANAAGTLPFLRCWARWGSRSAHIAAAQPYG